MLTSSAYRAPLQPEASGQEWGPGPAPAAALGVLGPGRPAAGQPLHQAGGRREGREGKAQDCALQGAPLELSFPAQDLLAPRAALPSSALQQDGTAQRTQLARDPLGVLL